MAMQEVSYFQTAGYQVKESYCIVWLRFWTVIARSGATKQSSWIATARFAGLAMTEI